MEKLMAYCVKTKTKEEMLNAEISKTSRGAYMAKGVTKDGNKVCALLSEANAKLAIEGGLAKQAF